MRGSETRRLALAAPLAASVAAAASAVGVAGEEAAAEPDAATLARGKGTPVMVAPTIEAAAAAAAAVPTTKTESLALTTSPQSGFVKT